MANDSTEELLATESPETENHIYEEAKWFDKAEQNQRMAVEELISTETSYVNNLQLCISDIHDHLQKKQLPEIDMEGLFSNIDDVLCFSKHFLKGLEALANQEHEQLLHISTLFQELKEEMENVYKVYCGNYDQALLLLDIYRKDPRLQKEILDTLHATVPHTGASDLSFFLVMPVQRVTKYPLFLQKILENTLDSDKAYEALSAATKAMVEVNANINEYKRRKEVADKYNKTGYLTLRERLARLNTHSIAKKTTRLSRLFMHEAGIIPKTEDKKFDDLEEKFQWLASGITDLKENVASFLSNAEMFLDSKPHENELNIEEATRHQCCRLAGKLNGTILPEFLPHKHLPEADFWKMVKDTLSQAENQLYSFSRIFESVMPSPVVQPLSPAEERRVLLLVNRHGPDKLYQVTSNISGSKDMDLTLQRGQVVALLHDMDTKGNSNRWLVDAGGPRGYIPSGKVQPYHLVQNPKSKMETLAPNDGANRRRHSYNSPETPNTSISFITPAFQVVAGYAFTARSSHEVSMAPGQPVTVLEPHDKKGSKEWSLVEVNGQKGYVPSSYLVTVPIPEPPGWSSPAWPRPAQQM
ncbi:rho guanine nucleotide exchange factor 37 isoform X2 [Heteronotia binoei]|uniref:rho guanine nucleotide exchange factor 37 isoform X2 n=1 Tax=Heteronotia binoei TaxID=13085 RepID=UPI00292D81CA|nr:rho guanine nucleotide exchange factor 37 isoform X2 [Heteronotia binoei]